MTYTNLSVTEVRAALCDIAQNARSTFGDLDERQLNWRPDVTRWSIAQCFDHLYRANELLLEAAKTALGNPPRTVWQRLPLWPTVFGWMMIRSQGPDSIGKFTAPARARPTSQIPGDIIQRFVDQHGAAEAWTRGLDQRTASHTIMISPFVRVVTYSVLDGLRLLVAHDHRHFEQARGVMVSLAANRA
jgi:hypothetical protein